MADPRDFLLNTDYEMDKIIYVKEGKIEPSTGTVNIPNPFSFRPLLFGLCSFNEDFSVPKPSPFLYKPTYTGPASDPYITYEVQFQIEYRNGNIQVYYNTQSSSPQTMYYRIYAFEPTNSATKIPPTKNYAKLFTLNTDRDYRKLYKKGTVDIGSSVTVNHNFGYIPQAMFWYDYPNFDGGRTTNATTLFDGGANKFVVDKDKVQIAFAAQEGDFYRDAKIHYRIYYDEA